MKVAYEKIKKILFERSLKGVFIKPYPNLFSKQSILAFPARYAPLCEAQSFC